MIRFTEINNINLLTARRYCALKEALGKFGSQTLFTKNKVDKPLTHGKILNSFAVTSLIFQFIFFIIFRSFPSAQDQSTNVNLLLIPLILNGFMLLFFVRGFSPDAVFLGTWVIPAAMLALSLYNPMYNYSQIIIIYMFMVLYFNNGGLMKWLGFSFLVIVNSWISFRYDALENIEKYQAAFELDVLIAPLVSLFVYLVHVRIRTEFFTYRENIEQQKKQLIEKNESLNRMILIDDEKNFKLKQMLMSKERLLSLILHDVRTPINSISFLIGHYEKGIIDADMLVNSLVEVKEDIVNLDQMVFGLAKLGNAFGKKSEGGNAIRRMDIEKVFKSVLSIYSLCAKNKNLTLSTSLHIQDDEILTVSKPDAEIILRNLVSNAIKFSHADGQINISLKKQTDNEGSPSTYALLSVQDFGKGMSKSLLDKLAASESASTPGTFDEIGLGIGLTIVFDLIRQNDLDYQIDSQEGKGTTFSIKIPMYKIS